MSKKRALILVLALLPLALGGAVVATLADGSRSVELASVPEATTSESVPTDTDEEIVLGIGDVPEHLPSSPEHTLAPSEIRERQARARGPENAPSDQLDAAPLEPLPAREGVVESDVQMAALVDHGWQLRLRTHTSWGLANRIRGGGAGGGSADLGPGEEAPSQTNGPHENTAPTHSDDEHDTRQPSNGPADDSVDENSEPAPNDDLIQPPKHGGAGPGEEEVVKQDPIHDGNDGGFYIPPAETDSQVVQVPEPAAFGLLGLGLIGCALARRRRG